MDSKLDGTSDAHAAPFAPEWSDPVLQRTRVRVDPKPLLADPAAMDLTWRALPVVERCGREHCTSPRADTVDSPPHVALLVTDYTHMSSFVTSETVWISFPCAPADHLPYVREHCLSFPCAPAAHSRRASRWSCRVTAPGAQPHRRASRLPLSTSGHCRSFAPSGGKQRRLKLPRYQHRT